MRIALTLILLLAEAAAKPCPQYGLGSQVVQLDTATVTADGGLLVVEIPERDGPDAPDRSKWQIRSGGKLAPAVAAEIAPGLVVYRPPAGATSYELVDDKGKVVGKATVAAKPPATLPAPRIRAITSGQTTTKHRNVFVEVELDGTAPDGAAVLVVAQPKGPARSWGPANHNDDGVNVYSNGSGCITVFPKGTVRSKPGDRLVAFWVDASGRRSPTTPVVLVGK